MEKLYPWRIGAIEEVISNCLVYATNIDKALKQCFKNAPKLGKKDRLFITEHAYSVIRNLYAHGSIDTQQAILKHFKSLGYDVSRLSFAGKAVQLSPEDYDAVFSVPNWLLESFVATNGEEGANLVFKALNARKQAYIRLNSNEISIENFSSTLGKEGIGFEESHDNQECLKIEQDSVVKLARTDLYNKGYFEYQDFASQNLISHVLPHLKSCQCFLDLCAGEGGKSVQLAQYFNDKVRYAYDIIPDKTKRLTRRFDRLKNTENPKVLTQEELALIQDLDCVLIDAPCSGTGTFGRLPVQKYHLSESHTEKMLTVQRSLLNDTVNRVISGGFTVYSTCSILRKENQGQVQQFLEDNPNFILVSEKQFLPTTDHDGLYVALLQKN